MRCFLSVLVAYRHVCSRDLFIERSIVIRIAAVVSSDAHSPHVRRLVSAHTHSQEFNAITGLNGSGKSNILDSICFVLGITNLANVRAANLTELVYKSGQVRVTVCASPGFLGHSKGLPLARAMAYHCHMHPSL